MIHSKGTYYAPIISVKGYSTGVHYWEVIPQKCSSDAWNTYIGIACKEHDRGWHLGADPCKIS